MPANVEVKAVLHKRDELMAFLDRLGAEEVAPLWQEDTFFSVPRGRLKMRCDERGKCELVYYRRSDEPGPRVSSYFRRPLSDPDATKSELECLFGVKNVVRKNRRLFILDDDVRIHVDQVEGLGEFLEIEVPVNSGRDAHRATHVARELLRELAAAVGDLVSEAYDDLLTQSRRTCSK